MKKGSKMKDQTSGVIVQITKVRAQGSKITDQRSMIGHHSHISVVHGRRLRSGSKVEDRDQMLKVRGQRSKVRGQIFQFCAKLSFKQKKMIKKW